MTNKRVLSGVLVLVLIFAMVVIGFDSGGGDDGGPGISLYAAGSNLR